MSNVRFGDAAIVDVQFGVDVQVIRPCNLYGCRIGDRSFIGPFCEIQRGVVIGSDCRIQSHSFVCELVTIGDHCVVAHGVMFINDDFSPGGPARGSNATLLPVTVADGVVIGAGSVVTRDLTVRGIYAGNPARLIRAL